MNSPRQAYRSDWSRIFLDTALDQALLNLQVKDGKCLHVGCGTEARYRELLSGFDFDVVDIADPQNKSMPWRYHRCDASRFPFVDAEFDLAVAIESFEHIENNAKAMQGVARSLKPGGWLVITTPTHWTWLFEFGRHGPHYYDKAALRKLLDDSAFEVHSCTACGGAFWPANLLKSWLSPIGYRLLRKKWWTIIDTALLPIYFVSRFTDRLLVFLPTNWLMVAKKSSG
jgi:SAM-dependent methyltransferase